MEGPRIHVLDGQDKLRVKLELAGTTDRIRSPRELIDLLGGRRLQRSTGRAWTCRIFICGD